MSTTTKARKKVRKTADKAAKQARKKATRAGEVTHDRAAELADLAERAGAVAQERAHELAERLRESDALARAQHKGSELAEVAKAKWHETELDERAAALAKQVREAEATREASRKAREVTDSSLAALSAWLTSGAAGEKLRLTRKPRVSGWMWALFGVVIGFAAARLMDSSGGPDVRQDLASAAERLAERSPHPSGTVLADTIRTTLQEDPRTAELRQLNINVAEGTVFVRGSLPSGIDTDAVRQVIAGVPGVEDVDLQLTPAS